MDAETGQLRSGATAILDRLAARRGAEHPKAKHEILESCIEVITGVCATVAEALADLAATVDEVRAEADQLGLELLCSGSHPLTDWATQETSPNPRYAQLVDQMQWMARQMQIFGVHVHVGVRSGEKVVPIVNALTELHAPPAGPVGARRPTGSARTPGWPPTAPRSSRACPPPDRPTCCSGWTEFEDFMETLISAGTISSIREVWWDIRPHPDFGTVELRIFDGLPTLLEVGVAAALSQCLVEMLDHQLDRGYTLPVPHDWVVRENKWRAARYGLDARDHRRRAGPDPSLRRAVTELVEDLAPVAERLGCAEELAAAHVVLETGPSSCASGGWRPPTAATSGRWSVAGRRDAGRPPTRAGGGPASHAEQADGAGPGGPRRPHGGGAPRPPRPSRAGLGRGALTTARWPGTWRAAGLAPVRSDGGHRARLRHRRSGRRADGGAAGRPRRPAHRRREGRPLPLRSPGVGPRLRPRRPHRGRCSGPAWPCSRLAQAGELPGRVRLVFQPAEEVLPGGALVALRSGALEGVGRVFALHCDPRVEAGSVALRSRPHHRRHRRRDRAAARSGRPHRPAPPHRRPGRRPGRRGGPHAGPAVARGSTRGPALSLVWGRVAAGSAANVIPEHARPPGACGSSTPRPGSRRPSWCPS